MTIKIEQAEFLFLKDIAEEILASDTYHAGLRRTLPNTDGTKIWHTFYRNGTKAAIVCAMLVAIEQGFDPISAVSTVVRTDPKPDAPQPPVDTFTDAALQRQGEAPKPDFNTLKKQYAGSIRGDAVKVLVTGPADVSVEGINCAGDARTFPGGEKVPPTHPDRPGFGDGLNDDIGRQEEELIPPGKMQYTALREPEPTPAPTEAAKNKGGRPKKIQPGTPLVDKIATAEDILDNNLRGKQP